MDNTPRIGGIIKVMREQRGWRLADVAERTGLSISYLSDIERLRTNPSVGASAKIAEAFDVDLSELFAGAALSLSTLEYTLIEAWRMSDIVTLLKLVTELAQKQANEQRAAKFAQQTTDAG